MSANPRPFHPSGMGAEVLWWLDLRSAARECARSCKDPRDGVPASSNRRPGLDWYDNLEAGRNSIRFWKITGEGNG